MLCAADEVYEAEIPCNQVGIDSAMYATAQERCVFNLAIPRVELLVDSLCQWTRT